LTAEVKYEPAAPVGEKQTTKFSEGAELFPHLYGTIDKDAVTKELQVLREGSTGKFLSIESV
jgi:uncharacterized protein (DUF952 family)